ncbi:sigma-54-dependent transcriptional regulator [Bacteroidota bacterium]
MNEGCILLVDDNQAVLTALTQLLESEYRMVLSIREPDLIPGILAVSRVDVVLLDMNFSAGESSGTEGLLWLKRILDLESEAVVVMMTAFGETEVAVRAMKMGATDFILKPWNDEKLLATMQSAYKLKTSKETIARLRIREDQLIRQIAGSTSPMIGESPAILSIKKIIAQVAPTESSVLILGENGTGKEMIAREIHNQSLRKEEVFIHVDLGSISDSLFESELFGHVRGAFTDASSDRAGRFEAASGGTLFLDEIGNLPYHLQGKLLSALQNREVYRLGSNKAIQIDIRIICATNQDIKGLIQKKLFREDLYYRINTIEITAPPLRERGNDIILLARHFIEEFKKKLGKESMQFPASYLEGLTRISWPGNIRQLRNHIERTVILSDEVAQEQVQDSEGSDPVSTGNTYPQTLEGIEMNYLLNALEKNKGNIKRTAEELGIARSTLYNKLKRYRIQTS